jgi:CysZ protein
MMLDAALKALAQMVSPPFRWVLVKAVGLAIALLVVIGIALQRVLLWLVASGGGWLETQMGAQVHGPVNALEWVLAFVAGLGLIAGAIFLMPVVTSLVAGFFTDQIAEQVERVYYPHEPAGVAVPLGRAVVEGVTAALLALVVYLCAIPFLLVAGLGLVIFFLANAYLLGRIYFELVAMRFHPAAEAKRLRRVHQQDLFVAGLFIAAFVSVPIVSLATPLFGTAFMVHVYKRLTARSSCRASGTNR